jgi:hypothetical protein
MPSDNRKKWLEVAARFPAMPPKKQLRIQERMTEWSRLTPQQRGDARVNFQQSKALKLEDRQAKWEAYLALPPDEREALALKARSAAETPPTKAQGGSTALRAASVDAQSPKSNLVPPASGAAEAPRAVSPSLVQGSTGATTSLVTSRPSPPVHQTTGQPKIAASSSGIDRVTLLPKAPSAATVSAPIANRLPAATTAPLVIGSPASASVPNP